MKFYLTTDTHFGHINMHDFCGRPHGFEKKILSNIWEHVGEDDTLIHLGDFCIGNDEEWHQHFMAACEGKKWLVRGNHDTQSSEWYLSQGWDRVVDQIHFIVGGYNILLSHIPIAETESFDLNIHGHHHNTNHHPEDHVTDKHRSIFIEHEYQPLSFEEILDEEGICFDEVTPIRERVSMPVEQALEEFANDYVNGRLSPISKHNNGDTVSALQAKYKARMKRLHQIATSPPVCGEYVRYTHQNAPDAQVDIVFKSADIESHYKGVSLPLHTEMEMHAIVQFIKSRNTEVKEIAPIPQDIDFEVMAIGLIDAGLGRIHCRECCGYYSANEVTRTVPAPRHGTNTATYSCPIGHDLLKYDYAHFHMN